MSEGVGFIKSLFFLNSKQTTLSLGRGKGVKKIMDFFYFSYGDETYANFPLVLKLVLAFHRLWDTSSGLMCMNFPTNCTYDVIFYQDSVSVTYFLYPDIVYL